MWVADTAQIQWCCGRGVGRRLQLQFYPLPGNLHSHRYGPKKQKKKKKGSGKILNRVVFGKHFTQCLECSTFQTSVTPSVQLGLVPAPVLSQSTEQARLLPSWGLQSRGSSSHGRCSCCSYFQSRYRSSDSAWGGGGDS